MVESSDQYHEGERAVQRAAGEEDGARRNAALIADAVAGGARAFLRAQRMLVVASRDARGRPWASLVFGRAGFASADGDPRLVTVDRTMAYADDADVLWADLAAGAPLGLLAIELSTRRRLRVNGRVESLTGARLVVRVDQAYPNCPKYIQRRQLGTVTPRAHPKLLASGDGPPLGPAILAAVAEADTVFVASGHPSRGLDASHRGGHPGFVEVRAPDVLRVPDYAGNSMFNTLGNLSVDARCGLTVLDFRRSVVHQMTGEATVHFDLPDADDDLAVTGRSWDFHVQGWRSAELPVRVEWEFVDYSPYNPP